MAALPDLSSRELQAICTVAECGSFVAAALTMNISQPALTRTVQRVEKALGVELFHRSTRRVETTAAGQEFVSLAQRVLADLRISVENMREISDELRGRSIVSAVMSVAYTQLPRIVARYRKSRPGIELQVREGVHGTVMDDVRSGVADMGITYIDDVPNEFSVVSLGREAFHVVMPRNHPLSAQAGVTLGLQTSPSAQPWQADRGALFTLLKNLLENAIQHSPPDGVVKLRITAQGFAVSDEGSGVSDAELSHLFDRFWRGEQRRQQGAGLGLAICAEIANAHGWTLTAHRLSPGLEMRCVMGGAGPRPPADDRPF
jgi:DNA-binding transcriptional LysR family regulator